MKTLSSFCKKLGFGKRISSRDSITMNRKRKLANDDEVKFPDTFHDCDHLNDTTDGWNCKKTQNHLIFVQWRKERGVYLKRLN